jgi:putative transposase
MDKARRYELLDPSVDLSIRRQSMLLNIPRGKFYYKPRSESQLNLYLMDLIDRQYQRTPFYGVPRMTDYLQELGYRVNHKRVSRLYKTMDIRALGPNPYTSKSDPTAYKYPYLLRDLEILYPNQVWVADITYIGLKHGYMYLFAIMDLYSRYILGWDISNSMTAGWCIQVLKECLEWHPSPEIFNTDQGSQFTADTWVRELKGNGIQISMDGKGRAIDNIFIERFWRSYKYEFLYLNTPNGGKELFDHTNEYIRFYNFERRHQSLNRTPPAEYYFGTKTYFLPTKYSTSLV